MFVLIDDVCTICIDFCIFVCEFVLILSHGW